LKPRGPGGGRKRRRREGERRPAHLAAKKCPYSYLHFSKIDNEKATADARKKGGGKGKKGKELLAAENGPPEAISGFDFKDPLLRKIAAPQFG